MFDTALTAKQSVLVKNNKRQIMMELFKIKYDNLIDCIFSQCSAKLSIMQSLIMKIFSEKENRLKNNFKDKLFGQTKQESEYFYHLHGTN